MKRRRGKSGVKDEGGRRSGSEEKEPHLEVVNNLEQRVLFHLQIQDLRREEDAMRS